MKKEKIGQVRWDWIKPLMSKGNTTCCCLRLGAKDFRMDFVQCVLLLTSESYTYYYGVLVSQYIDEACNIPYYP